MGTLKKFCIYFLIFIIAFFLLNCLTSLAMEEDYKNVNYEIKDVSPEVNVTECKAKYSTGYIKGSVTNNTGEYIPLSYMKIDLYDKDGIYMGTEYKELKYFNKNETIKFDIDYTYENIDRLEIKFVDKIINDDKEILNIKPIITEETIHISMPIAGALMFWYILPY